MSVKIKSRRPIYFFNLPSANIETEFVYNFFEKNESLKAEAQGSNLDSLTSGPVQPNWRTLHENTPRYVKVSISMDSLYSEFASYNESSIPFNITQDIRDQDWRTRQYFLNTEGLTPGQQIVNISLAAANNLINEEECLVSPLDRDIKVNNSLVVEKLRVKSKILSKLKERDIKTRRGIKDCAESLPELVRKNFIKINSIESVPGITTVNSISGLNSTKVFQKAANSTENIRVDRFRIKNYLSSLAISSIQNIALSDLAVESPDNLLQFEDFVYARPNSELINGAIGHRSQTGDFSDDIVMTGLSMPGHVAIAVRDERQDLRGTWKGDMSTMYLVGYKITRRAYDLQRATFALKNYYISAVTANVTRINKGVLPHPVTDYSYIDTDITYGQSYSYSVRPIFLLINKETADGEDDVTYSQALISGAASSKEFVKAIDVIPPKPPSSLSFSLRGNSSTYSLCIKWQPAINRQADTKYYQIFRRKSINEPFTCISMLDFDDSAVKTASPEFVNPGNVTKLNYHPKFLIDQNFKPGDSYIYAVCSVDAHGLTSNYSQQVLVKSDLSNMSNLIPRVISKSGAPKQYPNFYIDPEMDPDVSSNTLTQDYIGSSGKSKVSIYFDPDCRIITDEYSEDFNPIIKNLFITSEDTGAENNDSENGYYKFHFINTDRQKSSDIEIKINNPGRGQFE